MSKNKAIIPTEQRTIEFHGDTITAVNVDGVWYVPLRPMCENIGIDWSAQRRRVNRDLILSELGTSVAVTTTDVTAGSDRPKTSHMIALPLDALNGWLFGVNASRVDESIRDDLLRYQRDCYKVLHKAFSQGEIVTRNDAELLASDSPQGTAYRLGLAIAQLAREQYTMGKRIDEHDEQIADNAKQIGLIQAQLSNPSAYVTQEQSQQISEAVKAISLVLGERSGRNEFGGTYGELYRRYGITSYKHLPAARFDHCIDWLRQWWRELSDESDAPF